jgi:hypothetical protein
MIAAHREQGLDLFAQGLGLGSQELVLGLLAKEQQQLAAGVDNQAALLGFGLAKAADRSVLGWLLSAALERRF